MLLSLRVQPVAVMFLEMKSQLSPRSQATQGAQKNRLAPVTKPPGIDPVDLLNERENR